MSLYLSSHTQTDNTDQTKSHQAIGRSPETTGLGLEAAGVEIVGRKGYIKADEKQSTSVPGVYALGDVCGKVIFVCWVLGGCLLLELVGSLVCLSEPP